MTSRYIYFILIAGMLFSCAEKVSESDNSDETETNTQVMEVPASADVLSVETIKGENGWGYNILKDGKAFIRQTNIPSLPGNKGFDTQEKAKKVADFILFKIQNGIMPPSTNRTELDSLGVI